MNARELLDLIDKHASPHSVRVDGLDVKEIILRALRLLAAAESNDGTTPETDAAWEGLVLAATTHDRAIFYTYREYGLRDFQRIERERNGLAARVSELEKELQAHRVHLVEAIYGQPCPTPRQWEQMQEVAVKAMGARGSKP